MGRQIIIFENVPIINLGPKENIIFLTVLVGLNPPLICYFFSFYFNGMALDYETHQPVLRCFILLLY